MDVLKWVVFGVLPAVAAVLLGVGVGGPRFLAASLAVAVCLPLGMAEGWPPWPWALSVHHGDAFAWLWWIWCAAGVVGICYDARLLPKVLLLAADFTLVAMLPWLLSGPLRAHWSFEQCVLWLSAGWCCLGATWWVLRGVAKAQPGMAVPLVGTLVFVADTWVLRARGGAVDWQLAGVAAVALGLAVATTIWRRPFVCGAGGTLAITVVHAGLLYCGRPEGELLRTPLLLALLAPLPLGVALTKVFRDGRATGVVVGVCAVAGVAATAMALA